MCRLDTWRKRQREEADDLEFPDEIDTPADIPARTRFQRYRGLRSFRTSPWDPYENLPRDYARIFQFEDFKRTERGVMKRAREEDGTVEPGARVTIYLRDVPQAAAEFSSGSPYTIFGLFQHEHKKTVLNFTVQRNTEYDGSVRSKVQSIDHLLPALEFLNQILGFSDSMHRCETACSKSNLQPIHPRWRKGFQQRSQV
jgi:pre-rRNA-processing protein TSR1